MTILEITNEYKGKIDYLDLEIIIANSLKKTREFVLTYPKYLITKIQDTKIKKCIQRRISGEPIAYIIGHKEFHGLDFIVNKDTLVPRPETELMVEEALQLMQDTRYEIQDTKIIDIGTGSGCIIIAITNELTKNTNQNGVISSLSRDLSSDSSISLRFTRNDKLSFFATDISEGALRIAKKNAKTHDLDKEIRFVKSNLLSAFIQNTKYKIRATNLIITANLPYLSKEIYNSAPIDVKKFEPKSALFSPEEGLAHYRKLLEQVKNQVINFASDLSSRHQSSVTLFLEISPEQKKSLTKLIKSIFPTAKIEFKKDLASKWRLCKISI
ncbi:MAG: peptide chain release factor N(5)-glutamine methyltransferase [Candidatus Moranbacteria bacterium]|nr:peptide chain release factor N(5)-glutamine methyltransferase [Candidatus Moranbacteria bacterium]